MSKHTRPDEYEPSPLHKVIADLGKPDATLVLQLAFKRLIEDLQGRPARHAAVDRVVGHLRAVANAAKDSEEPPPSFDLAQAQRMIAGGMSLNAVARYFRVDKRTLRAHGVRKRPREEK